MKYLPTAIRQLEFAIKLWDYVEHGKIAHEDLNKDLRVVDGASHYVLPARMFSGQDDLRNAVQNNIGINFGAAAITLNRCREEAGVELADPVTTESDQWVGLVYQIRNAFAHDIAEPVWAIPRVRFRRVYEVAGVRADLSDLHGRAFEYEHIGGIQALLWLAHYGVERVFPQQFHAIHGRGLHAGVPRSPVGVRSGVIGERSDEAPAT